MGSNAYGDTITNPSGFTYCKALAKYNILCEKYKYGKTTSEEESQIVSLRETFGFPAPPRKGKRVVFAGVEKFYTYKEYVEYYLKAFRRRKKENNL